MFIFNYYYNICNQSLKLKTAVTVLVALPCSVTLRKCVPTHKRATMETERRGVLPAFRQKLAAAFF